MRGWREVHRVAVYLDAHRASLRPLAVQRCPQSPSPTIAEVHMVDGERWAWLAGTREPPAQLLARGDDLAEYPRTASVVIPLDWDRIIRGQSLSSCRKCRRTYLVDVAGLDSATVPLPSKTVVLRAPLLAPPERGA